MPQSFSCNSRTHRDHDRRRRGFTLLEVIVAVTIVALLATLVVPRLLTNIGTTKHKIAVAETSSIAQQINLYMVDNSITQLPSDFDLQVLVGKYLNKAGDLVDPWGHDYIVLVPGDVNPDFDVISYGRDGEPGGTGEDADVYNNQGEQQNS